MKKALILLLLAVSASFAEDLSLLYEKAYFLETAKGQTEEALEIYRQIAAIEATSENHEIVSKTLARMLQIYAALNRTESTREDRLEKAIALNAIGQSHQAEAMLLELSQPVGTLRTDNTQEHSFHMTILDTLLEIAVAEDDPEKIALYQKRLLRETNETIHSLILQMPDGGTVYLPAGVYSGNKLAYHDNRNIWIAKEITIKGADRDTCIIEGTMDRPIIHAHKGCKLTIDSVTLKSQVLSYNNDQRLEELGCALKVDNSGSVTLKNCDIIAGGNLRRCPLAIYPAGFSKVDMMDCRISGYAIPVYFGDGSSGSISNSILQNELRTGPDTTVQIADTLIYGSPYNAIQCGGGNLQMDSCLILNAGSALDIGSNTEQFSMSNSVVSNCKNIMSYFPFRVSRRGTITLNNNVFLSNIPGPTNPLMSVPRNYEFSACFIRNNILFDNTVEDWNNTFFEACFNSGNNAFWANKAQSIDISTQDMALLAEPQFNDPGIGDFTPQNQTILEAGHGLSNPAAIIALWKKYEETCK
jgi:tetratricopeptide (TPR) repeat protein